MNVCFSMALKDDPAASDWLAMIRDAGFDGVEPTFVLEGTLPTAADPRKSAEKLRSLADKTGLKIPSMRGGPGFWPTFASTAPERRKTAVDLASKAMEAVQIMGGDTLLIVPGQWDASATHSATWNAALDTAKRIADSAAKTNVKVGLENVENKFLLSPRDWIALLDAINSPLVKMYFDVGNTVYLGAGWPEQWIRELGKKYITRIHFKDADHRGAIRYMLEGQVNWPAVASALKDIGYSDWVGLELNLPAYHPAAMLAGNCRAVRDILK